MFRQDHRRATRPKIIRAIELAIFNDDRWPDELVRYTYRKLFNLTSEEMEKEPIDELWLNLKIYGLLEEKRNRYNAR